MTVFLADGSLWDKFINWISNVFWSVIKTAFDYLVEVILDWVWDWISIPLKFAAYWIFFFIPLFIIMVFELIFKFFATGNILGMLFGAKAGQPIPNFNFNSNVGYMMIAIFCISLVWFFAVFLFSFNKKDKASPSSRFLQLRWLIYIIILFFVTPFVFAFSDYIISVVISFLSNERSHFLTGSQIDMMKINAVNDLNYLANTVRDSQLSDHTYLYTQLTTLQSEIARFYKNYEIMSNYEGDDDAINLSVQFWFDNISKEYGGLMGLDLCLTSVQNNVASILQIFDTKFQTEIFNYVAVMNSGVKPGEFLSLADSATVKSIADTVGDFQYCWTELQNNYDSAFSGNNEKVWGFVDKFISGGTLIDWSKPDEYNTIRTALVKAGCSFDQDGSQVITRPFKSLGYDLDNPDSFLSRTVGGNSDIIYNLEFGSTEMPDYVGLYFVASCHENSLNSSNLCKTLYMALTGDRNGDNWMDWNAFLKNVTSTHYFSSPVMWFFTMWGSWYMVAVVFTYMLTMTKRTYYLVGYWVIGFFFLGNIANDEGSAKKWFKAFIGKWLSVIAVYLAYMFASISISLVTPAVFDALKGVKIPGTGTDMTNRDLDFDNFLNITGSVGAIFVVEAAFVVMYNVQNNLVNTQFGGISESGFSQEKTMFMNTGQGMYEKYRGYTKLTNTSFSGHMRNAWKSTLRLGEADEYGNKKSFGGKIGRFAKQTLWDNNDWNFKKGNRKKTNIFSALGRVAGKPFDWALDEKQWKKSDPSEWWKHDKPKYWNLPKIAQSLKNAKNYYKNKEYVSQEEWANGYKKGLILGVPERLKNKIIQTMFKIATGGKKPVGLDAKGKLVYDLDKAVTTLDGKKITREKNNDSNTWHYKVDGQDIDPEKLKSDAFAYWKNRSGSQILGDMFSQKTSDVKDAVKTKANKLLYKFLELGSKEGEGLLYPDSYSENPYGEIAPELEQKRKDASKKKLSFEEFNKDSYKMFSEANKSNSKKQIFKAICAGIGHVLSGGATTALKTHIGSPSVRREKQAKGVNELVQKVELQATKLAKEGYKVVLSADHTQMKIITDGRTFSPDRWQENIVQSPFKANNSFLGIGTAIWTTRSMFSNTTNGTVRKIQNFFAYGGKDINPIVMGTDNGPEFTKKRADKLLKQVRTNPDVLITRSGKSLLKSAGYVEHVDDYGNSMWAEQGNLVVRNGDGTLTNFGPKGEPVKVYIPDPESENGEKEIFVKMKNPDKSYIVGHYETSKYNENLILGNFDRFSKPRFIEDYKYYKDGSVKDLKNGIVFYPNGMVSATTFGIKNKLYRGKLTYDENGQPYVDWTAPIDKEGNLKDTGGAPHIPPHEIPHSVDDEESFELEDLSATSETGRIGINKPEDSLLRYVTVPPMDVFKIHSEKEMEKTVDKSYKALWDKTKYYVGGVAGLVVNPALTYIDGQKAPVLGATPTGGLSGKIGESLEAFSFKNNPDQFSFQPVQEGTVTVYDKLDNAYHIMSQEKLKNPPDGCQYVPSGDGRYFTLDKIKRVNPAQIASEGILTPAGKIFIGEVEDEKEKMNQLRVLEEEKLPDGKTIYKNPVFPDGSVKPLFVKRDEVFPTIDGAPELKGTPDKVVVNTNGKILYRIINNNQIDIVDKKATPVDMYDDQTKKSLKYVQAKPGEYVPPNSVMVVNPDDSKYYWQLDTDPKAKNVIPVKVYNAKTDMFEKVNVPLFKDNTHPDKYRVKGFEVETNQSTKTEKANRTPIVIKPDKWHKMIFSPETGEYIVYPENLNPERLGDKIKLTDEKLDSLSDPKQRFYADVKTVPGKEEAPKTFVDAKNPEFYADKFKYENLSHPKDTIPESYTVQGMYMATPQGTRAGNTITIIQENAAKKKEYGLFSKSFASEKNKQPDRFVRESKGLIKSTFAPLPKNKSAFNGKPPVKPGSIISQNALYSNATVNTGKSTFPVVLAANNVPPQSDSALTNLVQRRLAPDLNTNTPSPYIGRILDITTQAAYTDVFIHGYQAIVDDVNNANAQNNGQNRFSAITTISHGLVNQNDGSLMTPDTNMFDTFTNVNGVVSVQRAVLVPPNQMTQIFAPLSPAVHGHNAPANTFQVSDSYGVYLNTIANQASNPQNINSVVNQINRFPAANIWIRPQDIRRVVTIEPIKVVVPFTSQDHFRTAVITIDPAQAVQIVDPNNPPPIPPNAITNVQIVDSLVNGEQNDGWSCGWWALENAEGIVQGQISPSSNFVNVIDRANTAMGLRKGRGAAAQSLAGKGKK